jgi:CRISPR/Cas system-associated exonuclease Cas4 (RecB family)
LSGPRFDTEVDGVFGYLPATPASWSYSSLKEIEACPRRWSRTRATYPGIWDRSGYPPAPSRTALFGSTVHAVVERLTQVLRDSRATTRDDKTVVQVLSDLGGWRAIVDDELSRQLQALVGNPRVSDDSLTRIEADLRFRWADIADQAKVFLAHVQRAPATPPRTLATTGQSEGERHPLGPGVFAEVEVRATQLRIGGQLDLLRIDEADVEITDFKTGAAKVEHEDQVRLYALLWYLDQTTNPKRRVATRLTLAYRNEVRTVPPPSAAELQAQAAETAVRVLAADEVAGDVEPPAHPSENTCQFCQVKHLCAPYWSVVPPDVNAWSPDGWYDVEVRILGAHGTRSWLVQPESEPRTEILLRTVNANMPFRTGKRVRLLGVRRTLDPDDPARLVISMVNTSEWYALLF